MLMVASIRVLARVRSGGGTTVGIIAVRAVSTRVSAMPSSSAAATISGSDSRPDRYPTVTAHSTAARTRLTAIMRWRRWTRSTTQPACRPTTGHASRHSEVPAELGQGVWHRRQPQVAQQLGHLGGGHTVVPAQVVAVVLPVPAHLDPGEDLGRPLGVGVGELAVVRYPDHVSRPDPKVRGDDPQHRRGDPGEVTDDAPALWIGPDLGHHRHQPLQKP